MDKNVIITRYDTYIHWLVWNNWKMGSGYQKCQLAYIFKPKTAMQQPWI